VLDVFERKILRRIYGPVQDKGQWTSWCNKELYNLFKEPKSSITIRIARLRCGGHVRRMDEEAPPRRIMYVTPRGQRKTGRPKARWRKEAGKDARMLGIRSWWSAAANREEWRRLLREARTLTELMMMMMMIYFTVWLQTYGTSYRIINQGICDGWDM
jgi:hypothetical protein